MRELAQRAVNLLEMKRCDYGDVRVVEIATEEISTKNGKPENLVRSESLGFGVRALIDGCWGFAASSRMADDEVDRVVAQAIDVARASAKAIGRRISLAPAKPIRATYRTPAEIDPFAVPLDDKLQVLHAADKALRSSPAVSISQAFYDAYRTR